MSVSIASLIQSSAYTSNLTSKLEAAGLSSDKIDLVEDQLEDVVKTATEQGSGTTNASAIRSALDAKLEEDVKSGQLSQEDADKITAALDALEGDTATEDRAAQNAAACGGGGGGGGAGTSSEKTEVSRTETISGNIKTTTITYDDGTTEEETSAASEAEMAAASGAAEPEKASGTQGSDQQAAKQQGGSLDDTDQKQLAGFLAKFQPGAMFERYA